MRKSSHGDLTRKTWIIDSGSSNHITFEKRDFHEFKEIKDKVYWGTDNECEVLGIGSILAEVKIGCQTRGLRLENVLYVPKFKFKVFSLGAAALKRWRFCIGKSQITGIADGDVMMIGSRTTENFFEVEMEVRDETEDGVESVISNNEGIYQF
jgi:hypothetical protein